METLLLASRVSGILFFDKRIPDTRPRKSSVSLFCRYFGPRSGFACGARIHTRIYNSDSSYWARMPPMNLGRTLAAVT